MTLRRSERRLVHAFVIALSFFVALVPSTRALTDSEQAVVDPTGVPLRSVTETGASVDRAPDAKNVDGIAARLPVAREDRTSTNPESGVVVGPDGSPMVSMAEAVSTASLVAPTLASSVRVTIDRMSFGTTYSDDYTLQYGLTIMGSAQVYSLSDGSSWTSGAGSSRASRVFFDHAETSGSTIRYFFHPPATGSLYDQTDYDSGDHSSNGSLGAAGPLVLEAQIGSTTGRMIGEATILSNFPANYAEPRFNYWSAPVGAIAPFEATFTLNGGRRFDTTTFDSSFSVSVSGVVDFAASRRPPLIGLEIAGSGEILPNRTTSFAAIAEYEGGSTENVSGMVEWNVEPASIATIDRGEVTTAADGCDGKSITIDARFALDGRTQTASKTVLCRSSVVDERGDAWETYQGDERHSGYVPVALDPTQFALRWTRQVAPNVTLNPITAADGKVFVSTVVYFTGGDALFVLDGRDGERLWSHDFGSPFSVNPPAYGYGNVYIQTGDHASDTYLWAFEADTGALVFRSPHAAQWERYLAPTVYDGGVYVNGGYYGGMYAFDGFTGSNRWFADLPQYDQFTPAVDEQYVYAYVGEYAPALYVSDRATGRPVFQIPDPNFDWNGWSMGVAPVLGTENDVIAIHDGRLIKFDLVARRIAFELKAAFSGQPSVAKSVIYAIRDGGVEARRESDGGLIWRWVPPSGAPTGALIVTDTHVLAATNAATHALDVQTGQSAWTHPIGGHMALADDTLYIASGSSVTAIAMPGFSAAPPTTLAIAGPTTTGESGTTQYAAYVTYADGRVRERTRNASWTLSATASAEIDAEGRLNVGELLTPSERIVIHARYEENGVEVHADLDVELRIGVTLDEFVARNVTAAIDAQGRARDALQEALAHEEAAIAVTGEQARRSRSAGGIWRSFLTQLRKARILTLQSDQRARQSIDTLEGGNRDGKR